MDVEGKNPIEFGSPGHWSTLPPAKGCQALHCLVIKANRLNWYKRGGQGVGLSPLPPPSSPSRPSSPSSLMERRAQKFPPFPSLPFFLPSPLPPPAPSSPSPFSPSSHPLFSPSRPLPLTLSAPSYKPWINLNTWSLLCFGQLLIEDK